MYLITAKYSGDAERKRIEYIIKLWEDKANIIKPTGITFFVDGEPDEIVNDLVSKISEKNIDVFKLEKSPLNLEKGRKKIEMSFNADVNVVEKFAGFVMAKRKGVLKRESKKPRIKEYSVYTNKGGGDVAVKFSGGEEGEGNKETKLLIVIEAFEPALSYIYRVITEDFEYFKEGV